VTVNYKLIGQRIKQRRKERCLTQENIAEFLDISVSYVSRVERAVVKISLETLVKVAGFLDVSPAWLIEGTVVDSEDYLHGELADAVCGYSSEQMGLLLDIARVIGSRK